MALTLKDVTVALDGQSIIGPFSLEIAPGETVTLNIETTDRGVPDYAPLQRDFSASGHTSRKSFQLANGRATERTDASADHGVLAALGRAATGQQASCDTYCGADQRVARRWSWRCASSSAAAELEGLRLRVQV